MKITLNLTQEQQCHVVAMKRLYETNVTPSNASHYDKSVNYHDMISQHAEAIGAEMAVANYFNFVNFDPSKSLFKETADVSHNLEVKWTKYENGQLIIYPNDRNTDIAILVTGKSPVYTIAGWIPVAVAKKPKYKHSSQDTWWITQINLQPIENLIRSNYAEALG